MSRNFYDDLMKVKEIYIKTFCLEKIVKTMKNVSLIKEKMCDNNKTVTNLETEKKNRFKIRSNLIYYFNKQLVLVV